QAVDSGIRAFAATWGDKELGCGLLKAMTPEGASTDQRSVTRWAERLISSSVQVEADAERVAYDLLHLSIRFKYPDTKIDAIEAIVGGSVYRWPAELVSSGAPLDLYITLPTEKLCSGSVIDFLVHANGEGEKLSFYRGTYQVVEGKECAKRNR